MAIASPEPTSPETVPPTVYPETGGGGWGDGDGDELDAPLPPSPPPHPTMSRARNATGPIERNLMIPLQCLADGMTEIDLFMLPPTPDLEGKIQPPSGGKSLPTSLDSWREPVPR